MQENERRPTRFWGRGGVSPPRDAKGGETPPLQPPPPKSGSTSGARLCKRLYGSSFTLMLFLLPSRITATSMVSPRFWALIASI